MQKTPKIDFYMGFEVEFNGPQNHTFRNLQKFLRNDMPKSAVLRRVGSRGRGIFFDWKVKGEWSDMCPKRNENQFEIVSPINPLKQSLIYTKRVFQLLQWLNASTNTKTGLHINLSPKSEAFREQLFNRDTQRKLIINIPEKELRIKYQRTRNSNCQSIHAELKRQKQDLKHFKDIFVNDYRFHSFSLDLSKISRPNPYLEVRLFGGKDYHYRFDEIETDIYRLCRIIAKALKPTKFTHYPYYTKKLQKLLN